MPLEDILEKIKAQAEEEAANLLKEAQETSEEMEHKASDEARALKEEHLKEAQKKISDEAKRILAMARLQAKRSILEEKQALVDEAFQRAMEKLLSMVPEEKRKVLKNSLLKVVRSGKEVVVPYSVHKDIITKELLEEVNGQLPSSKGSLSLGVPEGDSPMGGFILREERMIIDCSFESLLKGIREEQEGKVAEILFAPVPSKLRETG